MAKASKLFYLQVGDTPYCEWLGCIAGQDKATQSGVHSCSHMGTRQAREAAKALQPFFSVPVRAVVGNCPAMGTR